MTQADNTEQSALGRSLERASEHPAQRPFPAPNYSPSIHAPNPERPLDMETYKAGRRIAEEAAEAVRNALAGLGLDESVWRTVRPMVTHSGKPYVHFGMLRADIAAKVARAIKV